VELLVYDYNVSYQINSTVVLLNKFGFFFKKKNKLCVSSSVVLVNFFLHSTKNTAGNIRLVCQCAGRVLQESKHMLLEFKHMSIVNIK